MSETPTPRTDALELSLTTWTIRDLDEAMKHARQLERELAEKEKELQRVWGLHTQKEVVIAMQSGNSDQLQQRVQELEEQLKQEKIWKVEDPRMLREHCRVADVAYNHLVKERDSLRQQLEEAENKADDEWLNAIAKQWNTYCKKPWNVRDGEERTEGIAANIGSLFQEIEDMKHRAELAEAKVAEMRDFILLIHSQEVSPLCECGEAGENFDTCPYHIVISDYTGQSILDKLKRYEEVLRRHHNRLELVEDGFYPTSSLRDATIEALNPQESK